MQRLFANIFFLSFLIPGCTFIEQSSIRSDSEGRYVGVLVDGVRQGQGRYTFPEGQFYQGEFDQGHFHGKGRFQYGNGDYYDGEWINNKRQGKGIYHFNAGSEYKGYWKNGQQEGQGVLSEENGNQYQGDWLKGLPHGEGVKRYADGRHYQGQFIQGKFSGSGIFTLPNGRRYNGQWREGQRSGHGEFIFINGDRYQGLWGNNQLNGQGRYEFADGSSYQGKFSQGRILGAGKFVVPDRFEYVGEMQDRQFQGYGRLLFNDGAIYSGYFEAGKFNGNGVFSFKDGGQYSGEWKNGVPEGYGRYRASNKADLSGRWKNGVLFDEIDGGGDAITTSDIGRDTEIMLSVDGDGNVVGKVGVETYFTIAVNSTGEVTFTQDAIVNFWHSVISDANDVSDLSLSEISTGIDAALRLTQKVTGADGDIETAFVDLVSSGPGKSVANFRVQGSGPNASLNVTAKNRPISLVVDEIEIEKMDSVDSEGGRVSIAPFSSLFGTVETVGADDSGDYGIDVPGDEGTTPDGSLVEGGPRVAYTLSLVNVNTSESLSSIGSGLYTFNLTVPSDIQGAANLAATNLEVWVLAATGVGVFVSPQGHVLTTQNVSKGCERITFNKQGAEFSASVRTEDNSVNLTLLTAMISPEKFLALSHKDIFIMKELWALRAFVKMPRAAKKSLESVVVSAVSGVKNKATELQLEGDFETILAGSPVVDNNGRLTALFEDKRALQMGHDFWRQVPENTQFAINTKAIEKFLNTQGLLYPVEEGQVLSDSGLETLLSKATVHLSCWMSASKVEAFKDTKILFEDVIKTKFSKPLAPQL